MNQIPPETRRVQSLLTSLIIVSVLILALVFIVAAYPTIIKPILAPATPPLPSARPPSALQAEQTLPGGEALAATATRSPRPTLTPSATPTPSQTLIPSQTPTRLGPPTLTPAQPVRGDPYKLEDWTADLANLAIELMLDYPNTLIPRLRGEDDRDYYSAFHFANLAAQEGLLRFPDDSLATQWGFKLAYSLAQSGDPQAGAEYARLLSTALNQGETDLPGLVKWFQEREGRLRLYPIKLSPPEGYLSSHILEVHGPGSAFIWLLETTSGYQASLLETNFDFVQAPDMRLVLADLTGDGLEEAVLFNALPPATELEKPRVFDLSALPAKELFFRPSDQPFNPGMEYTNNWRIAKNESGANDLILELRLFPACPVTVRQWYRWNGAYLDQLQPEYQVEPAPETLSLCRFVVEQAANLWGPQAANAIIESLLPEWPPTQTEDGKPYPADAKDEFRYRLGVNHALLGNFEGATTILNELVNQPAVPNSRWSEPATKFLELYKTPQDVYRACTQAQFCDPNLAITYLINQAETPADQDPVEYLSQAGLTLRSSGYFDFDKDETSERWFTVRHRPLEKLDLWILAATPGGQQAIYISPVEGDKPNLQYLDPEGTPLTVWVDSGTFIEFDRDADGGLPFIRRVSPQLEYPNRFRLGLQQASQALFAGEDIQKVLQMLLDLENSPGLLCRTTWSCDEYYYLLGLAHELAGNEREAIDAYLLLWRDYSRSPFTTLARLKLIGTIIPPIPSPTLTLTLVPTSLFTPGTVTPTTTIIVTVSPGLTPFPTSTPTFFFPPEPTVTSPYPEPSTTVEPTETIAYPTP